VVGKQAVAKLLLSSPLPWRGLIGTTTPRSTSSVATSAAMTITGLVLAIAHAAVAGQAVRSARAQPSNPCSTARPHRRPIGDGVVGIATLELGQLAIGLLQALQFPAAQPELDGLGCSSRTVAAQGI